MALSGGLGLDYPVAVTLARRGLTGPDQAREFLAGDSRYSPGQFKGIETVARRILEAAGAGTPITIYGDFDVDGVCATTILVELIRDLGGPCDWFIPDRISEGYGLSREALDALKERGSELVVTVDCGISSVTEVEHARSIGLEIIVTDHHQLGPALPDCEFLHPEACGYPFSGLCGAAVAWKLAEQVRAEAGLPAEMGEADLDLVALATVADMMPLVDENRHLVQQGLAVARRAARPGMRALLAESGVEPTRLEAEDFGFRLGPRINAAGRMYRADAGVELFLTESPERAAEISTELTQANAERKRVEREVETAAGQAFRQLTDEEPSVVVVAGEDWHPGVVGIVAARLARTHGLPAVVISTENGIGRGSARGVPGVDLYRALESCGEMLETYGGHRAAAGLSIRTERIDQFRQALKEAVMDQVGGIPVAPVNRVDACLGGQVIGMGLAEELDQLRPFGRENPAPRFLIPGARIEDLTEMGEGRHCRFTVVSGDGRAGGVAFGRNGFGDGGEPQDLVAELSVNHWNGTMTPRLQVIEAVPSPTGLDLLPGADGDEWWDRFEEALEGKVVSGTDLPMAGEPREVLTHRRSAEAVMGEVISSGEETLVLVAEGWRRWRSLGGTDGLARFSASRESPPLGLWTGSPAAARSSFLELGEGAIRLTDYRSVANEPGWVSEFENVVLFDPPANPSALGLALAGGGFLHRVDDRQSLSYALGAAEAIDPRPALRTIFRSLRTDGELGGEQLREVLGQDGSAPRSPEQAATLLKVMIEAGIARTSGSHSERTLGSVSSEGIDLEQSEEFRRLIQVQKEELAFLKQSDR